MKKIGKKTVALILALAMALSLMSVTAWARYGSDSGDGGIQTLATSGSMGDNITWTLDDNGLLTVSGSGAIKSEDSNYFFGDEISNIVDIVIEEGITSIPSLGFANCTSLDSVKIPSTVTNIYASAFAGSGGNDGFTMTFVGDKAPTFGNSLFVATAAGNAAAIVTIYYPEDAAGWSSMIGNNYGAASITWISYDPNDVPEEREATGQIGEAVYYTWDAETLTITVWGEGDTYNTYNGTNYPFGNCSSAKTVIVEDGVTSLSDYILNGLDSLESVEIAGSVATLGGYLFNYGVGGFKLIFDGDCPEVQDKTLNGTTSVTIYYPSGYSGWDFTKDPTWAGGSQEEWVEYSASLNSSLNFGLTYDSDKKGCYLTVSGSGALGAADIEAYLESVNAAYSDVIAIGIDTSEGDITVSGSAFTACTSLQAIIFIGNPPTFSSNSFSGLVGVLVYYPGYNSGAGVSTKWTNSVRQQYGGNVTWVDYEEGYAGDGHLFVWVDSDGNQCGMNWFMYDMNGNDVWSTMRKVEGSNTNSWWGYGQIVVGTNATSLTWEINIDELVSLSTNTSDTYEFKYATITDPNIGNATANSNNYSTSGYNPYGYEQFGSSEDPIKTLKMETIYEVSGYTTPTRVYTITCESGIEYTLKTYGNRTQWNTEQHSIWCPYMLNLNFYFGEPEEECTHRNVEHVEAKAATCTEIGNSEYWCCPDCNKYFLDSSCTNETTLSRVTIDALGHDYVPTVIEPTCTEGGYTTYACSRCDSTYQDANTDPLGHSYSEDAVSFNWSGITSEVLASDVTCEATFTCTAGNCGHQETVTADVTHTEENADCTNGGEEVFTASATIDSRSTQVTASENKTITVAALGHTLTKIDAVAPDCTNPGNDEYWTCSVCEKYFADENGEQEIEKNSWNLPALGHTPVTDPAVNPTCTETGLTEGSHCSVCNETIVAQEVVPATGHTLTKTDAVAPDCTNPGNEEYWTCSDCGKYFADENGEREIEKDSWNLPALGHTLVTDPAVEPTCEGTGLTEGSHCEVCDTVLVAQEEIPALGHDWDWDSGVVSKAATYGGPGDITYPCTRCDATYTDVGVIPVLTPYFDVMNETPSEYVTAAIGEDVELDAHYELDVTVLNTEDLDDALIEQIKTAALTAVTEMIETGAIESGDYELSEPFWLEIDLLKWLDSEHYEPIDESWFEITITVPIPEELLGADNYVLVRMHNGTAEVLEAATDENSVTVTFTTDRFSVYTLYAVTETTDAEGSSPDIGSEDADTGNEDVNTGDKDTDTGEDTGNEPATGDDGNTGGTETDDAEALGDTDSAGDTGSTGSPDDIGSDENESTASGTRADDNDVDETDATEKNGGSNSTGSGSTVVVGENEDEDADETADEDDSGKDNPKTDDTQMPYLMLTIFLLAIAGFAVLFVCELRKRSFRRH